MLRINRQTDYAVRVILALSKKEPNKRVPTAEIGREMLIPPSLLQRIVAELAGGGFILTQAADPRGRALVIARTITVPECRLNSSAQDQYRPTPCLLAAADWIEFRPDRVPSQ